MSPPYVGPYSHYNIRGHEMADADKKILKYHSAV